MLRFPDLLLRLRLVFHTRWVVWCTVDLVTIYLAVATLYAGNAHTHTAIWLNRIPLFCYVGLLLTVFPSVVTHLRCVRLWPVVTVPARCRLRWQLRGYVTPDRYVCYVDFVTLLI